MPPSYEQRRREHQEAAAAHAAAMRWEAKAEAAADAEAAELDRRYPMTESIGAAARRREGR